MGPATTCPCPICKDNAEESIKSEHCSSPDIVTIPRTSRSMSTRSELSILTNGVLTKCTDSLVEISNELPCKNCVPS